MSESVRLPSDMRDPIALADWLELSAIAAADGNASIGDLQCVLGRFGGDVESLCGASATEIQKRRFATVQHYPFKFNGSLLELRGDSWREFTPYVFCLLLSYCRPKEKQVRGLHHERMFEHLSCLAARSYIGVDGEAVRFGSPRDTMPKGFRSALEYLCEHVGEWNCGGAASASREQDDKLDIVAWRHFPDRAGGKLVIFGHCASGQDWDDKITELNPANFCSLWLGGVRSPVVTTFFIPHRIPSDQFEKKAIYAGLFFDRCRLAYWAANGEFLEITEGKSATWSETLLQRLVA